MSDNPIGNEGWATAAGQVCDRLALPPAASIDQILGAIDQLKSKVPSLDLAVANWAGDCGQHWSAETLSISQQRVREVLEQTADSSGQPLESAYLRLAIQHWSVRLDRGWTDRQVADWLNAIESLLKDCPGCPAIFDMPHGSRGLVCSAPQPENSPKHYHLVDAAKWQQFSHWVRCQQNRLSLPHEKGSEFQKIQRVVQCLIDNELKADSRLKCLREDVDDWTNLLLTISESIQSADEQEKSLGLKGIVTLIKLIRRATEEPTISPIADQASQSAPDLNQLYATDGWRDSRHWIVTAEAILSELNLLNQTDGFVTPEQFRSLLLQVIHDRGSHAEQDDSNR